MHEHVLEGCTPVPLAHYLKSFGILRLVSTQADESAAGWWQHDRFVLRTSLDADGLRDFFLHRYEPTPLVAPWNGGSGFYPKDRREALDALLAGSASRFGRYRGVLEGCVSLLARLNVSAKGSGDDKQELLEACRGRLPDDALGWLDAAFVLSDAGAKYPPLLGTGGNDRRLEFSRNYMERLCEIFDADSGEPMPGTSELLEHTLFRAATDCLTAKRAIGQFLPSSAGGANATTGFDAESLINPWDYVLMLEGALTFASTTARRLDASNGGGGLAYPFTVRQIAAGYGSSTANDENEARAEMWLPLWAEPAQFGEVQALLGEGRARVGRRRARTGLDFARAVVSLGVDRGLTEFQRYGFQVRNGLSYFATPIGRHRVSQNPDADLLTDIDGWLDRLRSRAGADTAPASVRRALRRVDEAVFALCGGSERSAAGGRAAAESLFLALGACEAALSRSLRWATDPQARTPLAPMPGLSPAWIHRIDDGSIELRLACAVASVSGSFGSPHRRRHIVPMRAHLEPVDIGRKVAWADDSLDVVAATEAASFLRGVFGRRLTLAQQSGHEHYADRGAVTADLSDVASFIEGNVDDARLLALIRAASLVDWENKASSSALSGREAPGLEPDAFYALLKLCFPGRPIVEASVPLDPRIHRLAARGDGGRALQLASRRLRGSGLEPLVGVIARRARASQRAAAALLFPLGRRSVEHLAQRSLRIPAQPVAEQGAL